LREHPDLSQLKRQAKELLRAFAAGDADASMEVGTHYHGASAPAFTLQQAQLVLARSYGFDSWPKLKAYVDGVTVRRLVDAVNAGDITTVTSMLSTRPELVDLDVSENDEHRALHHAVLQRRPAIVRLLMQYGADARQGIWPHRDATSPLTIATDRGYEEIVEVIREEETKRSGARAALPEAAVTSELIEAFRRGDEAALIRLFEASPALINASDPSKGTTALHWAAACLWENFAAWLLDRGADERARTRSGRTPLDVLGSQSVGRSPANRQLVTKISQLLLRHGAERTIRWAVATGDADWVRACHAEGALLHEPDLVSFAVASDQPEILSALLEFGFDPDERQRVSGIEEVVHSWGAPLRACARTGNAAMAEILLEQGADPNTNVYAASSAMHEAMARHDSQMVRLLEKHGGIVNATTAAYLGLADRVRQLFEDEGAGRLPDGAVSRASAAEDVLEAAADGGHVEIVRMALDHLDWRAGDARWQGMLMRPFGKHEPSDRERYVACFRMIIERSGTDLPWRFGRTSLHDVAADWPRSAPMGAEERLAFATILLEKGARLDARDDLLKSTPLGWACRWGRIELVSLLLARGADPVEADAEPWATPRAWAEKMNHHHVLAALQTRLESNS
jgi:ankyrin repeat protein